MKSGIVGNENQKKVEGPRAVIFDLDGVLVYTDRLHYQAWKELADQMGITFTQKDNQRLRGVSRMESLEIILEKAGMLYSEVEKETFTIRKNERYRELLGTMTPGYVSPQVRDTLAKLREQGYLLAVGSSSKNTRYIMEKTGLTDCFDAVSDGTNISRSKPDPEVFLKAAEYLGVSPARCIVVEDAAAGIAAAKAAGMTAVAIGENAGEAADHYIMRIEELVEYLTKPGT